MGDPLSLADLVTRPENSLINQSVRARERPEPLNGDGFGLAWYVDGHEVPARFRALTPAWSNANLDELARVTSSRCILAHVRAATSGNFEVSESNCHPFRRGRYAFMHNGHIPAFQRIRRALMARLSDEGFQGIRGTTDTEHVFALVAEHLPGPESESSSALLGAALSRGIREVHELLAEHAPGTHCYLNLVLSDGKHAAACRYSSDPELHRQPVPEHRLGLSLRGRPLLDGAGVWRSARHPRELGAAERRAALAAGATQPHGAGGPRPERDRAAGFGQLTETGREPHAMIGARAALMRSPCAGVIRLPRISRKRGSCTPETMYCQR
jgi:glutamine amidotransferase